MNESKQKLNKESDIKKHDILLKGYIAVEEETCLNEECPLKRFNENKTNYNVQKLCLLNYMNILFTDAIKKFPNSKLIIISYLQFNYEKKYNLNSAKIYLTKLNKNKNSFNEDFLIFCVKQKILNSKNNNKNISEDDDEQEELLTVPEESHEMKYKKRMFN